MSVAHPFATANSTSLKARLIKVDIGLFNCAWPSLWLHLPFSLFDCVPLLQWFVVFWCYIQEAFWVNWPLNEVLAAVDCDGEKRVNETHTHTQILRAVMCAFAESDRVTHHPPPKSIWCRHTKAPCWEIIHIQTIHALLCILLPCALHPVILLVQSSRPAHALVYKNTHKFLESAPVFCWQLSAHFLSTSASHALLFSDPPFWDQPHHFHGNHLHLLPSTNVCRVCCRPLVETRDFVCA